MASSQGLLFWIFIFCLSFELGLPLKCYECSSLDDEKCGKTWGYEDGSTKYLKDCVGELAACKKLEYNDKQQGGLIVTRSCWNTTDTVHEFKMECEELLYGNVCYCSGDDDKACNGGQLLRSQTFVALIVAGLSTLLLFRHLQ